MNSLSSLDGLKHVGESSSAVQKQWLATVFMTD